MSPQGRSLDSHVLFNRPIHDWISRVNRRRAELEALRLDEDQKERLRPWVVRQFVKSLADHQDKDVDSVDIDRAAFEAGAGLKELSVARTLSAFRVLRRVVEIDGPKARLTPELLAELHQPFHQSPVEYRKTASERKSSPVSPGMIADTVELACRWFSADSFVELHPVEQAGIVLLRLIEIEPFAERNEATAR